MAMLLTLSKRIMLSDHLMRSGAKYDRREFMGDDLLGRTIGIIATLVIGVESALGS